ncbi:elongation factor G [Pilimelia anulata]|uniref:Elongation factor G n=1 Tax=Pilimelia anulata TaxID=53371 RepID=A0A8J3B5Y7_9ACTN|nr:elongation factor G-like protein EF-G2 [Pilimelia anulata]GGJ86173.1 elongation factor G [Pilimelia anulata]
MANKGADRVAGPPPTVAAPAAIRNVAVVGHSGAGKTTLVEALLYRAGAITRMGDVAAGTTIGDSDPAAIAQGRSTTLSCAPLRHGDIKINLLDTPGYADFVGELRAGLRAADGALFVVSADTGVDIATATLWQECAAVGMPRAIAVTRLDHPRADPDETVALCQRVFGGEDGAGDVLPLSVLLPDGGVHQLVTDAVRAGADTRPATAAERAAAAEARAQLLEAIIAQSEDEGLMDRYLAGEPVDPAVVTADLERAVARGHFHPVVPACAATGVGLDGLLDLLASGFPSPLEHALPPAAAPDGTPRPLTCDPAGPLAAEVVKSTVDPYLGRVSLVRVFSGTLRPDRAVHVAGHAPAGRGDGGHSNGGPGAGHDDDERVAHVYAPLGPHLREIPAGIAGDLCAIARSGSARTGDTIADRSDPLLVAPWELPEPLLPVAVRAGKRTDEDALARNLARLIVGDPTMRLERAADTGQLVLWCTGEAHADVALHRLRAGGVAVETEPVVVPLRETFEHPARGHGRHVKQTGGHGQFAVVDLLVEPQPRGTGVSFVDKIVGGAVPHAYVPAVERGVRDKLAAGIAGHPVVDVQVTLVDGRAHSVDSSDAAFRAAAALALRTAAAEGGITLLEPVDAVTIRVPEALLGAVMGDLSGRRGQVLGTDVDPARPDLAVVRAEVPARELLRYAVELRAMTSGAGSFSRAFARYEPAPAPVTATR